MVSGMDLVQIYECFCDVTRLRIIHLLQKRSPLCVCLFQEVLQEPQVKISRHLAYLRRREMVKVEKQGTWRYYSLPNRYTRDLDRNLACLQDVTQEHEIFKRDQKRLENYLSKCAQEGCDLRIPEPKILPDPQHSK